MRSDDDQRLHQKWRPLIDLAAIILYLVALILLIAGVWLVIVLSVKGNMLS